MSEVIKKGKKWQLLQPDAAPMRDSSYVHKSKDQMVFFMFDKDDSIFKIFLNGLVTKSVGIDDHISKAMQPAT